MHSHHARASRCDPALHSPEAWLERFRRASSTRDRSRLRECRINIMNQTLQAIENQGYVSPGKRTVSLPQPTKLHSVVVPVSSYGPPPPLAKVPVVTVEDADCLDVALRLQSEGLNPVVMNMANASEPGGGYLTGAGAQEENLFRRSDYCSHLRPVFYPIYQKVVYTPGVHVFRSSEATGYTFLERAYPLSFIAVAAEREPQLEYHADKAYINSLSAAALQRKIETFCIAALQQGHDALVLSALGCGAFRNPPHHVADIFANVLMQFGQPFKRIVFAIFDDHNSGHEHNPEGNLRPFQARFAGWNVESLPSATAPSALTVPAGSDTSNVKGGSLYPSTEFF